MFPPSPIHLVPISRRPARLALLVLGVLALASIALAVAAIPPAATTACNSVAGATRAPHVQIAAVPGVDLGPVTDVPGLAAASGPFPGARTSLRHGGRERGVWLEGRTARSTAVDAPHLASGTWLRPGAVVVERRLASKLHLRRGDRVAVAGAAGRVRLRVAGIAVTSAADRSGGVSGVAYALPRDLRQVAPSPHVRGSTMLVRLGDRERAGAFAQWLGRRYPNAQATIRHAFPDRCLVRRPG